MAGVKIEDRGPAAAPAIHRHPRLPYLPALDGLRGVAVLAVLAFHAELLDGGFLGVDLFFVLSGFLITALLLVERRTTGGTSLLGFWGRRARRLLPAVLMVVAAVAVYAATLADPMSLARIRADGFATLAYVANWHDLRAGNDYWALFTDPSPLAHAWSLAIEEQLYLLWPVAVVAAAGRARRPADRVLALSLIGAVGSALWLMTQYAISGDAMRSYLGTDTRMGAVLVGAALAAFLEVTQGGVQLAGSGPATHPSAQAPPEDVGASDEPIEHPLALVGLAATLVLAWMWWTADGAAPFLYQGGFALHAIAAVALIATLVHPEPTVLHRLLSLRPLVWVGLISYGLYLWHWPIYVVLDADRTGLTGPALVAVRMVASFVVATLSYHLVERPVRTGRVPGRTLLVALPVAVVVVAGGLWAATSGAEEAALDQFDEDLPQGSAATAPRVLVAGDSLAINLGGGVLAATAEIGVRGRVAAEPGCSVLPEGTMVVTAQGVQEGGGCGAMSSLTEWVQQVLDGTRVDALVLTFALPDIFDVVEDGGVRSQPCLSDGGVLHEQTIRAATIPADRELKVFLLTSPPVRAGQAAEAVPIQNAITLEEMNERIACHNAVIERIAASDERVEVIDLAEWVCPAGTCRDEIAGVPLRPDGMHFGNQSAVNAGRWLLTQIDALGGLSVRGRTSGAATTTTVAPGSTTGPTTTAPVDDEPS